MRWVEVGGKQPKKESLGAVKAADQGLKSRRERSVLGSPCLLAFTFIFGGAIKSESRALDLLIKTAKLQKSTTKPAGN